MLKKIVSFASLFILVACVKHFDAKATNHTEAFKTNLKLGLAYLEAGKLPKAQAKLLKALRLDDSRPEVHAALGYYFERVNAFDSATIHYQRAMALAPGEGSYLNNYAVFLCKQGHFKEAMTFFTEAFKDNWYTNSASLYTNAGLCAKRFHAYKEARDYFKKALALDPQKLSPLKALVNMDLQLNRFKNARQELTHHANLVKMDRALKTLALNLGAKV